MRTPRLFAAALTVALGCSVSASSSSSPPSDLDPAAGKPVETAEPAEKPLEPAKPDPQAEAKKQAQERLAKLDAENKAEAARWTPGLTAATTKLAATNWRSLSQATKAVLASEHRKPGNAARDSFRHPLETLKFFGLATNMNVFEVGPGAGWWTEILAVVLANKGTLAVATREPNPEDPSAYYAKRTTSMLATAPAVFGKVERVPNSGSDSFEMGAPGSRDMILFMRAAHGLAEDGKLAAFLAAAHTTLKPGGVLAIEQHRAPDGADPVKSAPMGYLPQAWLIEQVEAAGFKLAAKSELNANPKDTKDYAKGVWALPPSLAEGDTDRAKYEAIGESDRMTLKFVKAKQRATPKAATDTMKTAK